MKNIHLIATEKPSRLYKTGDFLLLDSKAMPNNILETINQHLYITNSEEIKEGIDQWYLDKFLNKPRNSSGSQYGEKQDVIILTTDQDLDGVQAIDDEFLEWFVKNPSCERVKIDLLKRGIYDEYKYKIIIPKEEPKQECDGDLLTCLNEKCVCKAKTIKRGYIASETKLVGIQITLKDGSQQFIPKQETLEEAAEHYSNGWGDGDDKKSFIAGVKSNIAKNYWQAKQLDTSNVTRVEVIQHSEPFNGRAYTKRGAKDVEIQLQDDGRTLKIFLK